MVFGVRKPLANWNPFWANLQVYDYLLFDARKTQRWRDKIGDLVPPHGLAPGGCGGALPETVAPISRISKSSIRRLQPATALYRYPVCAGHRVYPVDWRALLSGGARAVLIPCVALWLLLLSLGWLNQGKAAAGSVELVRLLVVTPVLLLLAQQAGMVISPVIWVVAALYIAGSALWLVFVRHRTEAFA